MMPVQSIAPDVAVMFPKNSPTPVSGVSVIDPEELREDRSRPRLEHAVRFAKPDLVRALRDFLVLLGDVQIEVNDYEALVFCTFSKINPRDENEVVKVFRASSGLTVAEITAGLKAPEFN